MGREKLHLLYRTVSWWHYNEFTCLYLYERELNEALAEVQTILLHAYGHKLFLIVYHLLTHAH